MPDPTLQTVSASQAAALAVPADPARLWEWLLERMSPEPNTGCWIWLRSLNNRGYARTSTRSGSGYVHRRVYEALVGPIPPELELDHKCRLRPCINPGHAEPVTQLENLRRGHGPTGRWRQTHCKRGHEFTDANTYRHPATGTRQCRACHALREMEVRRA